MTFFSKNLLNSNRKHFRYSNINLIKCLNKCRQFNFDIDQWKQRQNQHSIVVFTKIIFIEHSEDRISVHLRNSCQILTSFESDWRADFNDINISKIKIIALNPDRLLSKKFCSNFERKLNKLNYEIQIQFWYQKNLRVLGIQ